MAPKFPLFTKKNDLTLIKTYGEVINLGKKIPILVTTVSRQALDLYCTEWKLSWDCELVCYYNIDIFFKNSDAW